MRGTKGDTTKARLYEAALTLLTESGERAVTAGKLASKAGVSKATIFHHFPELEDLPYAACRHFVTEISALYTLELDTSLRRADRRLVAEALRDELLKLGEMMLELASDLPRFHRIWIFMLQKAHVDDRYKALLKETLSDFRRELEDALALALPPSHRHGPRELAALLMIQLDGLGLHRPLYADQRRLWAAYRAAVDLVVPDPRHAQPA